MSFKFSGVVKVINPTQQVSASFAKRDFVLSDGDEKYPQEIMFQAIQDKCSLLDNVKIGDSVTVSFNLKGRGWTNPQSETKYFNTIEAWRIELSGSKPQAPQQVQEDDDLGLTF